MTVRMEEYLRLSGERDELLEAEAIRFVEMSFVALFLLLEPEEKIAERVSRWSTVVAKAKEDVKNDD